MNDLPERRLRPRFKCHGKATAQVPGIENIWPATITEISASGCLLQLHSYQELEINTMIELTFTVHREPFRVLGKVKSRRSETLVGFEFHDVNARCQHRIEELVREFVRVRLDFQKHLKKTLGN